MNIEKMLKPELVTELEKRGLGVKGNVAELKKRLAKAVAVEEPTPPIETVSPETVEDKIEDEKEEPEEEEEVEETVSLGILAGKKIIEIRRIISGGQEVNEIVLEDNTTQNLSDEELKLLK